MSAGVGEAPALVRVGTPVEYAAPCPARAGHDARWRSERLAAVDGPPADRTTADCPVCDAAVARMGRLAVWAALACWAERLRWELRLWRALACWRWGREGPR